jgi:hypothetical protein
MDARDRESLESLAGHAKKARCPDRPGDAERRGSLICDCASLALWLRGRRARTGAPRQD